MSRKAQKTIGKTSEYIKEDLNTPYDDIIGIQPYSGGNHQNRIQKHYNHSALRTLFKSQMAKTYKY